MPHTQPRDAGQPTKRYSSRRKPLPLHRSPPHASNISCSLGCVFPRLRHNECSLHSPRHQQKARTQTISFHFPTPPPSTRGEQRTTHHCCHCTVAKFLETMFLLRLPPSRSEREPVLQDIQDCVQSALHAPPEVLVEHLQRGHLAHASVIRVPTSRL